MNNMDEFVKDYLKNGTWYDFMGQSIFTKSEEVGEPDEFSDIINDK